MKLTNLALAVALGSAALASPKTPPAKIKIDCAKDTAPSCEVKRNVIGTRPDLFHGAKPKAKTVRL